MSRAPIFFAIVVSVALGAAASGVRAAPIAKPALAIAQLKPSLSVRGSHFAPAKRVRLRLTLDGNTVSRTVRSTTAGRFVASFATARPIDPCSDSFVVLAVGSAGERVSVKFVPRECPPAP